MAKFASGKFARENCDRCGWVYSYGQLRMEWNGLKTCPTCWESKHPQLEPRSVSDATALRDPRPTEAVDVVKVRPTGIVVYSRFIAGTEKSFTTGAQPSGTTGTGAVGTSVGSVLLFPTGVASTGAVPAENTPFWISGLSSTATVGTAVPTATAFAGGAASTGVLSTGTIGEENLSIAKPVSGVYGTGQVGDVDALPGWGEGAWGQGDWGQ